MAKLNQIIAVEKGIKSRSFQDLTGQRVSKVVATLSMVEDHLARMTEIWSVIERFNSEAAQSTAGGADGYEACPAPNLTTRLFVAARSIRWAGRGRGSSRGFDRSLHHARAAVARTTHRISCADHNRRA